MERLVGRNTPLSCACICLDTPHKRTREDEGRNYISFITGGIESALEKAKKAANGKDIRIGGGVSTVRQFLQANLIDEIHLAVSPVFLGSGEHLFSGIDLPGLGFTDTQMIHGEKATHIILTKK